MHSQLYDNTNPKNSSILIDNNTPIPYLGLQGGEDS